MYNFENLELSCRDRVLTIALNRPAKLNAFDAKMHSELSRAIALGADDPDSDVVVLTGNGRAFSAGGDIEWQQAAADDPQLFEATVREGKQIIYGLIDCEKPVLAGINGPAVGFGATIALFCDISFIARSTYISDPHVSVAMVAGDGGAVIWPQLIGFARAKEFLFTGDRVSAEKAERIGLVNYVIDDADLVTAVHEFAARLVSGAQLAIRYSKMTINVALRQLASSMMDVGLGYESMTNVTPDHHEALAAFREKRRPVFRSGRDAAGRKSPAQDPPRG